jgi:formamidopyrimidine-DNA glycosylase
VPELPDLTAYLDALSRSVLGRRIERVLIRNPFVLRSVEPPLDAVFGKVVRSLDRVGKRLVLGFDDDVFLVIHLMIAGRLRWRAAAAPAAAKPPPAKLMLAIFECEGGTLYFTEASSKKRASIRMVRGREALFALDPGGIEPLRATRPEFAAALTRESHTVKRALTDPRLFSGIGNAYSDEILHAAKLSPLKLTRSLDDDELSRLYDATRSTLELWIERLRQETRDGFPEKVTAFRPEMAVHGRFRQPCPVCHAPVQRIVYADNECNYCARCQTGGRVLADRSMSRLLKEDWPRNLEDHDDARLKHEGTKIQHEGTKSTKKRKQ